MYLGYVFRGIIPALYEVHTLIDKISKVSILHKVRVYPYGVYIDTPRVSNLLGKAHDSNIRAVRSFSA